ncbi:hypothetical protein JL722_5251 [Aureococcus anophagefferens]|nr:hypothetical protein JL722_5251 [Aureococcus anophagefferens]
MSDGFETEVDGAGEVTTEDLKLFAKKVAETELKRAQEDRRLSKMITRAVGQGDDLDASLLEQLQTLDENGDGEISGDEVVIFAKNFAAQQVTLAEEHARAEAAEAESKQLRTLRYSP